MYLGLDKDIFQSRIFAIYKDPDDDCSVVSTVFPGQPVTFDSNEFDQNGCLNMTKWFGKYWDKTMNDVRGSVLLDA